MSVLIKYIFHNDDYGFFVEESKRIIRCITDGVVNSVSVMGNSKCLPECIKMVKDSNPNLSVNAASDEINPNRSTKDEIGGQVLVAVHLNIVDGIALSEPSDVGMLTDLNGVFVPNFGKMLIMSYIPVVRGKLKRELKREISKQIANVMQYMKDDTVLDSTEEVVRLDSHLHYHQLPVMFDALMEVIKEEDLKVSYIRMPREKTSLYRKAHQKIKPINMVKAIVLNVLCFRNSVKYRKELSSYEKRLFLGVCQSGNMTYDVVSSLWPFAKKWADKHGCGIEILNHPGGVKEAEDLKKVTFQGDYKAFTSPLRDEEGETWIKMRSWECL